MKNDLLPIEKRIATAKTWSGRIDNLLKKKKSKDKNYSEAEFCRDHDFDPGFFNRNKNLRVVPTQKTIDAIEEALSKEGV